MKHLKHHETVKTLWNITKHSPFDATISVLNAPNLKPGGLPRTPPRTLVRRKAEDEDAMTRFGKSTIISMTSNSVTHRRSYTNSAIADIAGNSAPISPVTPNDQLQTSPQLPTSRSYSWSTSNISSNSARLTPDISASSADIVASNDLRAIADVTAPNADVSTSSADVSASSTNIVASNDECSSVSWCFTMFLVFHDVLLCLTMFSDV